MPLTEKEIYDMRQDVALLKKDVGDIKLDLVQITNTLDKIERHLAVEEGGQAARAELQKREFQRLELTWAKLGALGCIIGGVMTLAPYVIHHFMP
jgi:hypothetical protein